jgi:hypothetical protein
MYDLNSFIFFLMFNYMSNKNLEDILDNNAKNINLSNSEIKGTSHYDRDNY